MPTILDLLTDTLVRRLSEAGFDVPQDITQKQKESFVLAALEDAVVLQANEYDQLVEAARQVGIWQMPFVNSTPHLSRALTGIPSTLKMRQLLQRLLHNESHFGPAAAPFGAARRKIDYSRPGWDGKNVRSSIRAVNFFTV